MKKSKELNIKITHQEATLIFSALAKRPFEEVFELIGKLNFQITEQSSKEV
ncbi:hypothetical protein [Persicobacter psychrovividus]|uniref:Uncharacterized protein n=1 Tax=Persicobacter psychrovividus TaxID=387638 RepID=A0ABM7VKG0_9BACT|nr:hypothetical protein PEPS_36350 [Persicobacter psychrovividus]